MKTKTNPPTVHAERLLSRKEVATLLGVCGHTIARNPRLKPVKFNERLVRYRAQDVEAFIQSALMK